MSIVCLDTQVIRWGVMREPSKTPDAAMLVEKAIFFIDWLDQQRSEVILPAFVIGELLVTVPEREHPRILNQLNEDWMIVDYDLRAAQQFAIMRYNQALKPIMDEIKQGNPYATRKQMIVDAMIIATAIVHGAEKIYSHDEGFVKMASSYLPAENFLDISVQKHFLDVVPNNDNTDSSSNDA
jgi:predicted nucleic acid-binding protein